MRPKPLMAMPVARIATADADARADPHEATKKLVGGKHVSETLTRSLFEGSRLFDDDAERDDWVTKFVREKLLWMSTWAWTDVLSCAFYW